MHIENLYITLNQPPAMAAALLKAMSSRLDEESAPSTEPMTETMAQVDVAIGERWPGLDGIYVGLARGLDGEPDGHLVLLDAKPDAKMAWPDASAWAELQGAGARLPTRFESALLYANAREHFDLSTWYWTSTQYSKSGAWDHYFHHGHQTHYDKKYEALARAVRRFPA